MRADAEALGVDTGLLLSRETPLVHVLNVSGERVGERVRALLLLARGGRASSWPAWRHCCSASRRRRRFCGSGWRSAAGTSWSRAR